MMQRESSTRERQSARAVQQGRDRVGELSEVCILQTYAATGLMLRTSAMHRSHGVLKQRYFLCRRVAKQRGEIPANCRLQCNQMNIRAL
jgi:hypothetical protein